MLPRIRRGCRRRGREKAAASLGQAPRCEWHVAMDELSPWLSGPTQGRIPKTPYFIAACTSVPFPFDQALRLTTVWGIALWVFFMGKSRGGGGAWGEGSRGGEEEGEGGSHGAGEGRSLWTVGSARAKDGSAAAGHHDLGGEGEGEAQSSGSAGLIPSSFLADRKRGATGSSSLKAKASPSPFKKSKRAQTTQHDAKQLPAFKVCAPTQRNCAIFLSLRCVKIILREHEHQKCE